MADDLEQLFRKYGEGKIPARIRRRAAELEEALRELNATESPEARSRKG